MTNLTSDRDPKRVKKPAGALRDLEQLDQPSVIRALDPSVLRLNERHQPRRQQRSIDRACRSGGARSRVALARSVNHDPMLSPATDIQDPRKTQISSRFPVEKTTPVEEMSHAGSGPPPKRRTTA
ncbi:hypothetical protein QF206_02745 [Klugiella sp. YN-L-19]|uniref:Uncharacterized protein n=1 Tax=Ruicaihuangia caeni TaxID=3042517 RepID=A0AAW6T5D5_9MICO|nr:hypothetical protein [Klugiella sp. YN-L-19]